MKYGGTVLGDHPKNQMTIVLKKGKGGGNESAWCVSGSEEWDPNPLNNENFGIKRFKKSEKKF